MADITAIKTKIANSYIVSGDFPPFLVDVNTPRALKKIKDAIRGKGYALSDISKILITHYHYDHTGCLAGIKRLTGATVVAGSGDIPLIEGAKEIIPEGEITRTARIIKRIPARMYKRLFSYQFVESASVDMEVDRDMEISEIGIEAIFLPGHTHGGTGYYMKDESILFCGDMVSNWFGKISYPVLSSSYSMDEIKGSMKRIADLGADYIYPGHGKIIGPNASEKVREFLEKANNTCNANR